MIIGLKEYCMRYIVAVWKDRQDFIMENEIHSAFFTLAEVGADRKSLAEGILKSTNINGFAKCYAAGEYNKRFGGRDAGVYSVVRDADSGKYMVFNNGAGRLACVCGSMGDASLWVDMASRKRKSRKG